MCGPRQDTGYVAYVVKQYPKALLHRNEVGESPLDLLRTAGTGRSMKDYACLVTLFEIMEKEECGEQTFSNKAAVSETLSAVTSNVDSVESK